MYDEVRIIYSINFVYRVMKYLIKYIYSVLSNSIVWEKLRGKTVVITGATQEIGYEICKQLAGKDIKLLLISHDEIRLKEIKRELCYNTKVDYYVVDMNAQADNYNAYSFLEDYEIGLLINAAVSYDKGFSSFVNRNDNRMLNINVVSTTNITHRVITQMVAQRFGHVLVLGSSACDAPAPYIAVYSATNAYLQQLCSSLYYEMKNFNVTVEYIKLGCIFNIKNNSHVDICGGSTKKAVRNLLRTFGSARYSIPNLFHVFMYVVISFIPKSFLGNYFEWKNRRLEYDDTEEFENYKFK